MFNRNKKEDKDKKERQALVKNHDQIAKALEILFATEYVDQKRLYLHNFFRGMAFSAGGIIGATLIISLVIWLLSLFNTVPLIGPVFDKVRNSIETTDQTTF